MSEVPAGQLERFPTNELSPDETRVLKGISYTQLPQDFTISQRVLDACLKVQNTKSLEGRTSMAEMFRRTKRYLSQPENANDPDLERKLSYVEQTESQVTAIEFGLQFYRVGNEVIMGKVHKGSWNEIHLRNQLDGIPDGKSIVQVHKHPNDLPQSPDDIAGIITTSESIPERCLYYVTGPGKIHLLFPTTDTPRLNQEEAALQMREFTMKWAENKEMPYPDLVKEIAEISKLGFYTSPQTAQLKKI